MFYFSLAPVNRITLWGNGSDKYLHWDALSYGVYDIRIGSKELLRASDELVDHMRINHPSEEVERYVAYQVAYFHDEVLRIRDFINISLPPAMASSALATGIGEIRRRLRKACAQKTNDEECRAVEVALEFLRSMRLDMHHLVAPPNIWFWRRDESVIIGWDNRGVALEGVAAWAEQQGQVAISYKQFINDVESFRDSFLGQMKERVHSLVTGDITVPGVSIDIPSLVQTQAFQERPSGSFYFDIDAVVAGISTVL